MALRVVKVLAEVDAQKGSRNGTVSHTLAVMEEHCKLRIGKYYSGESGWQSHYSQLYLR
jgi:hypothetical protein